MLAKKLGAGAGEEGRDLRQPRQVPPRELQDRQVAGGDIQQGAPEPRARLPVEGAQLRGAAPGPLRGAEEGQGAHDGGLRRGRLPGRVRPLLALHDNQDQGDIAGRPGLLLPPDLEDAGLPEDGRPEHAQLAPVERDIARPVLRRAALRHTPLQEPAGVPRRVRRRRVAPDGRGAGQHLRRRAVRHRPALQGGQARRRWPTRAR